MAEYSPIFFLSAFALVVGIARRSEYSRMRAFSHPIFIWLTVFILMQPISLYYGGIRTMLDEFADWYIYLLFVVISTLLITDPIALKRFVWGMIFGGMFIVGYGIYALIVNGGYEEQNGRAGAYGMYINHNDYSFIIIQIIPFIFVYMQNETEFFRRGMLGICLITCIAGIFLSLSRGGILALVVEITLIILLALKSKRRFLLLPVVAIVGAISIQYLYSMRADNQTGEYDASMAKSSRYEFWEAGMEMIVTHPFLGVGSRRYMEFSKNYGEITHSRIGRNSHNTYIEILAGSGLLGFIPFVLFIVSLIRELNRRPVQTGPPWLEPTRIAALISLYSILARAFTDAKQQDWSFYTLCVIGLTCIMLSRHIDSSVSGAPPAEKHALRV